MKGVPVSGVLSQFVHECADHPGSKLIHAIIVVAEFRKLAFSLIVGYKPGLVPNCPDPGVPDRGKTVGNDRHAAMPKAIVRNGA